MSNDTHPEQGYFYNTIPADANEDQVSVHYRLDIGKNLKDNNFNCTVTVYEVFINGIKLIKHDNEIYNKINNYLTAFIQKQHFVTSNPTLSIVYIPYKP